MKRNAVASVGNSKDIEVVGSESKLLGIHNSYNHDVNPSEGFLSGYPLIAHALRDKRLIEQFELFEARAKSYKKRFQLLGLWSLLLGLIPLCMSAARLAMGEAAFTHLFFVDAIGEVAGVASICVGLWLRRRRYRVLWCQAVFCRERLRQWHFQKFLDGKLISLAALNKRAYEEELLRRWVELEQNLADGYGMMMEFVRFPSRRVNLFHVLSEYDNESVADAVFLALWTLRFEHQLRYSRRKIESDGEQEELALGEKRALSDTVASASLAGAIVVSALALFTSTAQLISSTTLPFAHAESAGRVLAGTGLLLAVISAASRAYRAGYTLPEEAESYEEYCDRVRELGANFNRLSLTREKLQQCELLEEESAMELRRFLKMKSRATFVS